MRRTVLVPVILALLLAPLASPAAEPADTGSSADTGSPADTTAGLPTGIPELRGHRFVPTALVPSPFIRTTLRNTLGFGTTGTVETPPITVGGTEIQGLKGSITAVALVLEYQIALKRWLALRGEFGLAGQFGTGVQTILAEGMSTVTDFEFGWVFSLREGERTALAGALNISNRSVTGINIFNLVSDIVEGTDLGLTQTTPVLNANGDLRWAWAASELVGFSLSGTLGNGETLNRQESTAWFYGAGLAVSFDLDKYGWPLGVVLSGSHDNFGGATATERDSSSKGSFVLSYIGRDSFVLSLDISQAKIPTSGILETLDITAMGFSLQYFF